MGRERTEDAIEWKQDKFQLKIIGEIRKRFEDGIVSKFELVKKSDVVQECRWERTWKLDSFKNKVSNVLIGADNANPSA